MTQTILNGLAQLATIVGWSALGYFLFLLVVTTLENAIKRIITHVYVVRTAQTIARSSIPGMLQKGVPPMDDKAYTAAIQDILQKFGRKEEKK